MGTVPPTFQLLHRDYTTVEKEAPTKGGRLGLDLYDFVHQIGRFFMGNVI